MRQEYTHGFGLTLHLLPRPCFDTATRSAALAAYEAGAAKGGNNADKRGVRRAREICPSFKSPLHCERIRRERQSSGTPFIVAEVMFANC
jgi:hypothetical protein